MFRFCFIVSVGLLLISPTSSIYSQKFERTSLLFADQAIQALSFLDLNNDFFPDFGVFSKEAPPSILLNKEGKTFYDSPLSIRLPDPIEHLTWIDYNNDGLLDLFTISEAGEASIFESPQSPYGNEYPFILSQHIEASNSNQWLDINQDGWMDLYVAPQKASEGYFFEYTPYKGFQKLSLPLSLSFGESYHDVFSWIDLDENGTEDLFVTSQNQGPLFIKNKGNQKWYQITPEFSQAKPDISLSHDWIDFDNDGDLDLFIVNKSSKPELLANNGYGKFTEIPEDPQPAFNLTTNAQWVDIDNDGDLDIITQSPIPCEKNKSRLICHFNNNQGSFSSTPLELCSLKEEKIKNFLCTDYDLDGKQDLVIKTERKDEYSTSTPIHLFKNRSSEINNWLLLKCLGSTTNLPLSNSHAIGVKVYVKTIENGQAKTQMRTLKPQLVSDLQGDMLLHFGLGSAERIASMRVEWPSGRIDYLADLAPNHLYVWRENEEIEKVR